LQDIKTAALMLIVLDARERNNLFRLKPEKA
jgi:hypothetical protein